MYGCLCVFVLELCDSSCTVCAFVFGQWTRSHPAPTYKYEAPVLRLAQVLPVDISPFAGQTGDIWNRVKQVLLAGAYLVRGLPKSPWRWLEQYLFGWSDSRYLSHLLRVQFVFQKRCCCSPLDNLLLLCGTASWYHNGSSRDSFCLLYSGYLCTCGELIDALYTSHFCLESISLVKERKV